MLQSQIFSSKNILIGIIAVLAYFTFNHGIPFILNWDLFGHYAYLPNLTIQGSLKINDLTYFESIQHTYQNTPTFYQFVPLESGGYFIKYTAGWAILMSPFYAIAHAWALLAGGKADGFSAPYQCMLAIGAFSYAVFGLIGLRKLLLHFFTDQLTSWVLVLGIFGTNFLFMQYASLGISHALEFFLLVWMLLVLFRFYAQPSIRAGMLLGGILGFIFLVRPPDLVFALIPLCWKMNPAQTFKEKCYYFWNKQRKILLLLITTFLVVISPQLLYWKFVTGNWVMNSYANNPGEGFDFTHPYVLEFLFSFRKGWLLYTPLMAFACLGFIPWIRQKNVNARLILVTVLVFVFVASSWTTWWYAESFSQRSMLDVYPILWIAFGFTLQWIFTHRFKLLGLSCIGLCVCLNLFQTFQMTKGILHGSRMSKAYYLATFGQLSYPTEAQKKLLLIDHEAESLRNSVDLNAYDSCFYRQLVYPNGLDLNATNIYTPKLDILPSTITEKPYFWVQTTWKYVGNYADLSGKFFTTSVMYNQKSYGWKGYQISDTNLRVDTLNHQVKMHYFTPYFRTTSDPIRIGIWNQSGTPLKILSVEVKAFEPKHVIE